jgi:hypothetical protein
MLTELRQVRAARRQLVRSGQRSVTRGDQPVGELEKRHRVIGTAIETPLEPDHWVTLVSDREFRPQMPVTGIFLIDRR